MNVGNSRSKIGTNSNNQICEEMIMNRSLLVISIIISVLTCALLLSCEPAAEPYRNFIIRKGEHYAYPKLTESLQSQTLVFDARFNKDAIYDFHDEAIQSDKNKLMGFCDCNSLVHENSARFAWQWFNNRLEIYAYCYVNSQRQEHFVGVVNIEEYNHYEIELTDGQYIFRLNNNPPVYMKRGNTCSTGVYLKLWPYFGGHVAAPHDVTIDIKSFY